MDNREIDALVAEKVMGWRWATCVGTSILFPPLRYEITVIGHPVLWSEGKSGTPKIDLIEIADIPLDPVPHYSIDISAAWQVVERLIEAGLYPVIWVKPGIVQLYAHNEICNIEEKGAIPLAICLAALKAVGVEIVADLSEAM